MYRYCRSLIVHTMNNTTCISCRHFNIKSDNGGYCLNPDFQSTLQVRYDGNQRGEMLDPKGSWIGQKREVEQWAAIHIKNGNKFGCVFFEKRTYIPVDQIQFLDIFNRLYKDFPEIDTNPLRQLLSSLVLIDTNSVGRQVYAYGDLVKAFPTILESIRNSGYKEECVSRIAEIFEDCLIKGLRVARI